MRKLSKQDLERLANARSAIEEARAEIESIIEAMKEKIEAAVTRVNDARDDAYNALDDLVNEAQSYYDEKSEKWQEGDNGQQYQSWISALESARDELGDEFTVDLASSADLDPVESMMTALEEGTLPETPDQC